MSTVSETLAATWRLAAPYFSASEAGEVSFGRLGRVRMREKWAGRGLLAAVISIELAIVAITVSLNAWNARFYDALQNRNWDSFVAELGFFCVLAAMFILLAVYQVYLNQWLQIRWRRWMTERLLGAWLSGANHYRMQLLGESADNPDQRIAEDIQLFVEQDAVARHRPLERAGHVAVVRRHPVGTVGPGAADVRRHHLRHPRLSGAGSA